MRPLLVLLCAGMACTSRPTSEPAAESPAPAPAPVTDAAATPDTAPAASTRPVDAGQPSGPVRTVVTVALGKGYLAPIVCAREVGIDYGDACMDGIAGKRVVRSKKARGTAVPGRYPIDCADDEPVPESRPALRLRAADRRKFGPRTIASLPHEGSAVVEPPQDALAQVTPAVLAAVRTALRPERELSADQAFELDIDGDGTMELVLAVSAGGGGVAPGGMVALVSVSRQSPYQVREIGPWGSFNPARGLEVLAVTDLDANGRAELIVWETWQNDYYVLGFEIGSQRSYKIGCGMV